MNRNIVDEIADFLYRMKKIKESILVLEGGELLNNHKKTLLFSLLDTMSVAVFGDKMNGNRGRFENFILSFCEWDNAERISIQQMALLLDKTDENEFGELKKYTFNQLSNYPISRPVPFSIDPTEDEVRPFLHNETIYKKIKINDMKHVNLLWRYRNSLIHEARSLGADQLFDFEVEPHYIQYYQLEKGDEGKILRKCYWQKHYPIEFFINLVETAILKIESYLIENEINPFGNYDFEPLWIKVR